MKISVEKKFKKFKEGMKSVSSSEGVLSSLGLLFVGTVISLACITGGVSLGVSVAPLAFASAVASIWTGYETIVKIKNPFNAAEKGVLRNKSYRRLKRAGVAVAGLAITGAFALVAVKSSSVVVQEYKKSNKQQENKKEPLSGLRKCNPIFDDCRRTFIADAENKASKTTIVKNSAKI